MEMRVALWCRSPRMAQTRARSKTSCHVPTVAPGHARPVERVGRRSASTAGSLPSQRRSSATPTRIARMRTALAHRRASHWSRETWDTIRRPRAQRVGEAGTARPGGSSTKRTLLVERQTTAGFCASWQRAAHRRQDAATPRAREDHELGAGLAMRRARRINPQARGPRAQALQGYARRMRFSPCGSDRPDSSRPERHTSSMKRAEDPDCKRTGRRLQ